MKTGKEKLIGKYLSGNASLADEKELFDWIKEDGANEVFFEEAKNIWATSLNLKKEGEDLTEKAWQDFKILAANEPAKIDKKVNFRPLQIAAAIALVVTLVLLIKYFVPVSTIDIKERSETPILKREKEKAVAMITIQTTDSAKTFFLPDSSCIHLNKKSSFTYPKKFDTHERATSLSGEAFFEIINNGVAFAVTCKETKTMVVGTSFNIKGYEEDKKVTVSVVTGTVELSNNENKKVTLTANERGTFNNENTSLSKTNYTDKNFIWWKKNTLKTRIKKIIKKLKQKIN
ncbi:MAG: FecR domain-containing protein [Bacteroidetes bacterium]|nr:FecR domain-containing protein [Bacteroidota bacterium]